MSAPHLITHKNESRAPVKLHLIWKILEGRLLINFVPLNLKAQKKQGMVINKINSINKNLYKSISSAYYDIVFIFCFFIVRHFFDELKTYVKTL